VRALVTGATALVTQAFLWVTVAPSRSQTPADTSEAEEPPHFVKNVMAELWTPLALVKPTAGHLSTTPPIQVLGPNAHRVAVVFITPARAAVAVAAAPQEPEIGGAAIVLPPLSGQTAFLDERARKAWSAVADRNADADLVVWEVVR
jgi:hypothetical protein